MTPSRIIQPLGLAVSALVKGWMSTLDYKIAYYDPSIDPAVPFDDQSRLYLSGTSISSSFSTCVRIAT